MFSASTPRTSASDEASETTAENTDSSADSQDAEAVEEVVISNDSEVLTILNKETENTVAACVNCTEHAVEFFMLAAEPDNQP